MANRAAPPQGFDTYTLPDPLEVPFLTVDDTSTFKGAATFSGTVVDLNNGATVTGDGMGAVVLTLDSGSQFNITAPDGWYLTNGAASPTSIYAVNSALYLTSSGTTQLTASSLQMDATSAQLTGALEVINATALRSSLVVEGAATFNGGITVYPLVNESVQEVELTSTTASTVATATPTVAQNALVGGSVRVTGSSTVTIDVTWTDATGAQTDTLMNAQALTSGTYSVPMKFINSAANDAIEVVVTSTAASVVYASAVIKGM